MMNKDKSSSRKGLLKEAVDELGRLRVLIVQIMNLPESVDDHNIRCSTLSRLLEHLRTLGGDIGNAEWLAEQPPYVLRGYGGADTILDYLLGGIEFHIEDSAELRGEAEEALAHSHRTGHFPREWGLPCRCGTPKKRNSTPNNKGVK